jgi:hypothetical protein
VISADHEVWSCFVAGIAGSSPAEGMVIRLLCLLCVVYVAAVGPKCVWRWNLNSVSAFARVGMYRHRVYRGADKSFSPT